MLLYQKYTRTIWFPDCHKLWKMYSEYTRGYVILCSRIVRTPNYIHFDFQCREIGYETHEEILKVLHELHTTMKTYHSYQSELRQAEAKLRSAEIQRTKLEQTLSHDKLDRSKKYKLMEKEVIKVGNRIY